jgi:pimeloyl-ACP methyl ester carboxylesterase
MKSFRLFTLFFLFTSPIWAQDTLDIKANAQKIIAQFKARQFEQINPMLDYEMSRILGANGLEDLWDGINMQFGEVKQVKETTFKRIDTLFVSKTPVVFENKTWLLKIVFNLQGKMSGLFLEPLKMPYEPPAYADESLFYEYKKTLADPKYPVEGLLSIPRKGKDFPVLIILAGSGPSDKDLSIGSKRIYKDIAWGLASQNIAVFRFDKRTYTHKSTLASNPNLNIDDEYTQDLKLAIAMLQQQPNINPKQIYVMGHSLGGHLLPYLAGKVNGVKGYIGLFANYSGLPDLMVYQADFLSKDLPENKKLPYQQLKQKALYARDRFGPNSPNDSLPDGLTTKYLLSLNQAAPKNHLKSLRNKPFMFIQGEKDYQVPTSEMDKWQAALQFVKQSQTSFVLLKNINHLGTDEPGEMGPGNYEKPGNVSPLLIKEIEAFIKLKP